MDQTQRDVQKDVQTIREICNSSEYFNSVIHPSFNQQENAIEAWVRKTYEEHAITPMPWQILLDDQGTRILNLKVATKLYMSGTVPHHTVFAGNFLEHLCFEGKNITKAFIDFEDDVTGHVCYPLTVTASGEVDEVLNAPLKLSKVNFRFNGGARVHFAKNTSLIVPKNVYEAMIESTYEEPIYFGPDQSLCIFEGHIRYARDVVVFDDHDSEILKGALN
tara:strand:- start:12509 stop:13168 length:660 start_codon:yes stop_codon:yes gene_type:complete